MMQLTGQVTCLATLLAAAAWPLAGQEATPLGTAAAEIGDDDGAVNFSFGDSCEKLQELSREALSALTSAADEAVPDRFCAVREPADCEDLSLVVEEFGRLAPGLAPGLCRFVPSPTRREISAKLPQNLGLRRHERPASPGREPPERLPT